MPLMPWKAVRARRYLRFRVNERYYRLNILGKGSIGKKAILGPPLARFYNKETRGWGTWLLLTQRTVEDHHRGKKYSLATPEVGQGTTFLALHTSAALNIQIILSFITNPFWSPFLFSHPIHFTLWFTHLLGSWPILRLIWFYYFAS